MAYQFDFASVWQYREMFVTGALHTLALTGAGAVLGVGLGVFGAVARAWKLRPFDAVFATYVELIRNTPFIVQLFFIFFGLPSLGVQLSEWTAATIAVVVNLGAYSTEIVRAGIQATPRGQIEAAASLAMTRRQIFMKVVLRPALQRVWPALTSQIVIVMLGTSVCSQIAAEELTFAANFIQSRNFRAFETYIVTALAYLLLAAVMRQVLLWFGRRVVTRRAGA